jgi:hypothetical protein
MAAERHQRPHTAQDSQFAPEHAAGTFPRSAAAALFSFALRALALHAALTCAPPANISDLVLLCASQAIPVEVLSMQAGAQQLVCDFENNPLQSALPLKWHSQWTRKQAGLPVNGPLGYTPEEVLQWLDVERKVRVHTCDRCTSLLTKAQGWIAAVAITLQRCLAHMCFGLTCGLLRCRCLPLRSTSGNARYKLALHLRKSLTCTNHEEWRSLDLCSTAHVRTWLHFPKSNLRSCVLLPAPIRGNSLPHRRAFT